MRVLVPLFVCVTACAFAPPVSAASRDTRIYQYKNWEVRLVTWDDGSSSCVAEVSYVNGDAFSIWQDKSGGIRLQLYSPDWNFGAKDRYADIELQVDNHNYWRVAKADFYKNSVLIDPPDDSSTHQFLAEIKTGNQLFLYAGNGKRQSDYSLAGSQASLDAMGSCLARLR